MFTLLAISFFLWILTYLSARRFYDIFNEKQYPLGKVVPISGLLIGLALYVDHVQSNGLSFERQETQLMMGVFILLTGTFVNTISFLFGKKQYHDEKGKNTAGFVFITIFNIIGLISAILGIAEFYLSHRF